VKRGQFPRGYQFLIVNLAVQITYILINQIGEGEIDRERERDRIEGELMDAKRGIQDVVP